MQSPKTDKPQRGEVMEISELTPKAKVRSPKVLLRRHDTLGLTSPRCGFSVRVGLVQGLRLWLRPWLNYVAPLVLISPYILPWVPNTIGLNLAPMGNVPGSP